MSKTVILHYTALSSPPKPDEWDWIYPYIPKGYRDEWHDSDHEGRGCGLGLLAVALTDMGLVFDGSSLRRKPGGKPYLLGGPSFSISHSGSYVGVALGVEPLGFDWEPVGQVKPEDLRLWSHRSPPWAESATQAWVAMEAALKASGGGLNELDQLRFKGMTAILGGFEWSVHTFLVDQMVAALATSQPIDGCQLRPWTRDELRYKAKDWHNSVLEQKRL